MSSTSTKILDYKRSQPCFSNIPIHNLNTSSAIHQKPASNLTEVPATDPAAPSNTPSKNRSIPMLMNGFAPLPPALTELRHERTTIRYLKFTYAFRNWQPSLRSFSSIGTIVRNTLLTHFKKYRRPLSAIPSILFQKKEQPIPMAIQPSTVSSSSRAHDPPSWNVLRPAMSQ